MTQLYERIYETESQIGLWAGEHDHRPRIERFHDAVRAYTSGVSPYDAGSRLSIEQLAWDISMLRSIQANPLTPMPKSKRQSASQEVAIRRKNSVSEHENPRANARALRGQLAEHYRNYAVMFTALLAETADMNHASRMEEKDMLVEEMANLRANLSGKTTNLQQLAGASIHDAELLNDALRILPKGTLTADQAVAALNNAMRAIDSQQQRLEKAHLSWLSGQLAMYEQGKEVVQQLMRSGMNLAGKFLQDAMSRGDQGLGRGF